jgi:hypothetical protein
MGSFELVILSLVMTGWGLLLLHWAARLAESLRAAERRPVLKAFVASILWPFLVIGVPLAAFSSMGARGDVPRTTRLLIIVTCWALPTGIYAVWLAVKITSTWRSQRDRRG